MKVGYSLSVLASLDLYLLAYSSFFGRVSAKDECQPYRWDENGVALAGPKSVPSSGAVDGVVDDGDSIPKPGDVNCREKNYSPQTVNYYTCTEMASENDITNEKFFLLNPGLKGDCSNIQPNSRYCTNGFIEPLRAFDGLCGPNHKNATCHGTGKECCNSETWTCGNSAEDCAPGTCFEGRCAGDRVWSTDGTCGAKHGNRQCAGKQGACCGFNGKCGSGESFCGDGFCQSGNCTTPPGSGGGGDVLPWQTGNTTDGRCGGAKAYVCDVTYGNCCNKSGKCGSLPQDCGEGCQPKFGRCSSTNVA